MHSVWGKYVGRALKTNLNEYTHVGVSCPGGSGLQAGARPGRRYSCRRYFLWTDVWAQAISINKYIWMSIHTLTYQNRQPALRLAEDNVMQILRKSVENTFEWVYARWRIKSGSQWSGWRKTWKELLLSEIIRFGEMSRAQWIFSNESRNVLSWFNFCRNGILKIARNADLWASQRSNAHRRARLGGYACNAVVFVKSTNTTLSRAVWYIFALNYKKCKVCA